MGAYLSEPVTEKVSSDEANDKLECGASSMQGWRVNQEVLYCFVHDNIFQSLNIPIFISYQSQSLPMIDQLTINLQFYHIDTNRSWFAVC